MLIGFAGIIASRAVVGAIDLGTLGKDAQAIAQILTGLIAVLGVPLALSQVVNLRRQLFAYERERQRSFDASANLVITARDTLTRPAVLGVIEPPRRISSGDTPGAQPSPKADIGKRLLRLDLTLRNVGEGAVDVLGCLVSARSLDQQGEGVAAEGRDAQWDDLTAHYWNNKTDWLSPGLSTTKHVVYASDALARIKADSHKVLSRIDQINDFTGEVYLLYRVFVVARRSARTVDDVENWTALQRALLNVNSPAFREASNEPDPLGLVAAPNGWRLFVHHYEALADPKLRPLRAQADRELAAITEPAERAAASVRLDEQLQEYCRHNLLPAWKTFRKDLERAGNDPRGFAALEQHRKFAQRQRESERRFPWDAQEIWTDYFYILLQPDATGEDLGDGSR